MGSVDVVVPCYRYGHFLKECIDSVLAQAGVNVRALIIDDASPDSTSEIALSLSRDDSRVSFIRHSVNMGHIATYNHGIEWASADYYMILSADDYLLPGALSRSVELMDSHPAVGLTFGQAITLIEGNASSPHPVGDSGTGWKILSGLEFIRMSGANNVVPTPTAVVRTELQKRLGGYRPELPHSGDMEMWLRLAAHSDVGISEACQAVYRRHDENMSSLYYSSRFLPDIQQRKAAVDCFLNTCSDILPEAKELHKEMLRRLAEETLECASSAFNHGEKETSLLLSQLACDISPHVRRSICWRKLHCKRYMSPGMWNSLRSPISWVRQLGKTRS